MRHLRRACLAVVALPLLASQTAIPGVAAVPPYPFQVGPVLTPPSIGPDYSITNVTIDPSGTVWVGVGHPPPPCNTENLANDPGCHYDGHFQGKIARLNADGTFTEFGIPTPYSYPRGIVPDNAGNIWFIDTQDPNIANAPMTIDRMSPTGQVDVFVIPLPPPNNQEFGAFPGDLTLGPDGNLYFLGHYGGNQALNDLLGRVALDGTVTWFPLGQGNYEFFGERIVSVGGVLWFTGTQFDSCLTCFPSNRAVSLNDFAPNSNTFGEQVFSPDVQLTSLTAGPGDGMVWGTAANSGSYGIGRVDRLGRLFIHTAAITGFQLLAGNDNRVYMTGSSGCGGLSRIDELDQVDEAMVGNVFIPEARDAAGSLWGVAQPGCSSPLTVGGIQKFTSLDGPGPQAPSLGPASAAFTYRRSFALSDGTGDATVPVQLNACASGGEIGSFNWTIGSNPLVPFPVCDFHTRVPVGDVSVTLGVSGVPGGPPLSSVTQNVHTVPTASFTFDVDTTQVGKPFIRLRLNPCSSSGFGTMAFTVLDQTFGTYLVPFQAPNSDPNKCGYWYADLNPGYPYQVTLRVNAPSPNTDWASMQQVVIEQMQPVFRASPDFAHFSAATTNIHFNACDSLGVLDYQFTVKTPSGTVVADSPADTGCTRDLTVPLHVSVTDPTLAFYKLVLTASNGAASQVVQHPLSMMAALGPPPTLAGCQAISLGPDSCAAILGSDVWALEFGAKRPPDFIEFNVEIPPFGGGVAFACDGSTYLSASLVAHLPLGRVIEGVSEALHAAVHGIDPKAVAAGWVGNPEDLAPTNHQIDEFLGPGPLSYQIGGTFIGASLYILSGEVDGQPQVGLLLNPGAVIDIGGSVSASVNLAGPLTSGSTCVDGAVEEAFRAIGSGHLLGTLEPFGAPQTSVNLATSPSQVSVAPNQTVGVLGTGLTPGTQYGASIHSDPIALGTGTVDANGNFSFSFTVPAALTGTHQLVVTGQSQGQIVEQSVTLNVGSRSLAGNAANVNATEGAVFSGTTATFTDTSTGDAAGDFTASIAWGDGGTSPGTVAGPSGGPFTVTGTNTYAEEGAQSITTTLTHTLSGVSATVNGTGSIADPGAAATGGFTVSSVEGTDSGSQTVATFKDPAGAESGSPGSHYTADIQWGDGTTSAGAISGPDSNGMFAVAGSHSYAEEGSYAVQVAIHHEGATDAQATSGAVVTPRNGEILFSRASTASGTDHHAHIWVMNPDGTNAHALTSGSYNDTQPAWSLDGTRIVFTSTRNGYSHIFVMNADGTGVTAVTSGTSFDLDPTWSPDGASIAFTSTRGGHTHIYVVAVGGGTPKALTSGSSYDATPAWSPDGTKIAFTSTRGGNTHIYVMKASDGTGVTALTSGAFYEATPAWSPDGTMIAFISTKGGNTHIYAMQSNGAGVTALTSGSAFDALPAWSADGSRITFTSTRGGQIHIYVTKADGSALTALTSGQALDASPSWRAAE